MCTNRKRFDLIEPKPEAHIVMSASKHKKASVLTSQQLPHFEIENPKRIISHFLLDHCVSIAVIDFHRTVSHPSKRQFTTIVSNRQARTHRQRRPNVYNYVVDEVKYERDWARDCSAIAIGALINGTYH